MASNSPPSGSPPVDYNTGFPRISPLAWKVDIFISLAVALVAAGARTYLRIIKFRRLDLDDCFLLFSAVTFLGSIVCAWLLRETVYLQVGATIGILSFDPNRIEQYLLGDKVYLAASILIWTSIFSIKFSFMFFFQKLLRRVRSVEIYWWAVMAILIPSAAVNIFFGFFMCTDFSINFLETCSTSSLNAKVATYMYVTTIIDILTDILVVSIPVVLVWNVNITLYRKIGVCIVLCLSTVMIVFAIVQVTLATLQDGNIDTVWLFFWSENECCVAIIMVSLTAFRSLFGLESTRGSNERKRQYVLSSWNARSTKRVLGHDLYGDLPDVPGPHLLHNSRKDADEMNLPDHISEVKHNELVVPNHHDSGFDQADLPVSKECAQSFV